MDAEKMISGLVRVGTVTDVDNDGHKARVKFQGENMTSGWLFVLDNKPYIPDYDEEPQHTEKASGGSGEAAYDEHQHELIIKQWMPKINDTVLCLYLPGFNADGFVVGGIS